jgi:hypothetical protein
MRLTLIDTLLNQPLPMLKMLNKLPINTPNTLLDKTLTEMSKKKIQPIKILVKKTQRKILLSPKETTKSTKIHMTKLVQFLISLVQD